MPVKPANGPWSYRVKKGKNGELIVLVFQAETGSKDEMFVARWFPPWQNELMRRNAAQMVADLNAAFAERNRPKV